MRRIDLLKPKFMLRKELEQNVSSLSVDDYFLLSSKISIPISFIEKNEEWKKSSDILLFNLKRSIYSLSHFEKSAVNQEVIDFIALNGMNPQDLDKFSFLLNDKRILTYMLVYCYADVVNNVDDGLINEDVIKILEKRFFTFDEELIKRCPSLLNSERIVKSSISLHPELIKYVKDITSELLNIVLDSDYVPSLDDLLFNPKLLEQEKIVIKAIKENNRILCHIDPKYITPNIAKDAVKNGFVPSEQDLIDYPHFITMTPIITAGIENDPSLIRYLNEDVYVKIDVIDKAMKEYHVTVEDLYKFPRLTTHVTVMGNLPAFYLFGKYVTNEDKANELYDYLTSGSDEPILEALPFFDKRFNAKVDIDKILEIMDCLKLDINQQDIKVQQKYSLMLDQIINGITNFKFAKERVKDKFQDIVAVNKEMNKVFSFNSDSKIAEFIVNINKFVGNKISVDEIKEKITNFYQIYLKNGEVTLDDTKDFCNRVLNCRKDSFTEEDTRRINGGISKRFRLSSKQVENIIKGKKIETVELAIRNGRLNELGISEDTLNSYVDTTVSSILSNKDLKKLNIVVDSVKLDILATSFKILGVIDRDNVISILGIKNEKAINFIVKKFNGVKSKIADGVNLSEEEQVITESDINKVLFNYNHFDIFDNIRYMENLCQLLTMIDQETIDAILENKEIIPVLANLLPLVGVIPEFNIDAYISMLSRLDRINFRVKNNENDLEFILNNFSKYLELAESYALVGDIDVCSIGKDVVNVIDEFRLKYFIEPYLKTFERESNFIPPVYLEEGDLIFESGRYTDPQRLLVGFRPDDDSCIRPDNPAGAETFDEILHKDKGDLIAIKDKNGELRNRILVIRRGNTIQFILKGNGLKEQSIYTKLAMQMMEQAIENDDNLEYIFISGNHDGLEQIQDRRLKHEFGHADTLHVATLLVSKNRLLGFDEKKVDLDLEIEPNVRYNGVRKAISYAPRNTDIDRLRALNIKLTKDEVLREELARNFSPFFGDGCKHIVCGEDWYLIVTNDDEVEELILPVNSERAEEEILEVKEQLGISLKDYRGNYGIKRKSS